MNVLNVEIKFWYIGTSGTYDVCWHILLFLFLIKASKSPLALSLIKLRALCNWGDHQNKSGAQGVGKASADFCFVNG